MNEDWRKRYDGQRKPGTVYLVGIAEAAMYLGLCQATIYTYLRQGRLDGVVRDQGTWCFATGALGDVEGTCNDGDGWEEATRPGWLDR